jgi:hypothetical protein
MPPPRGSHSSSGDVDIRPCLVVDLGGAREGVGEHRPVLNNLIAERIMRVVLRNPLAPARAG